MSFVAQSEERLQAVAYSSSDNPVGAHGVLAGAEADSYVR
jgi:hypothetical protein